MGLSFREHWQSLNGRSSGVCGFLLMSVGLPSVCLSVPAVQEQKVCTASVDRQTHHNSLILPQLMSWEEETRVERRKVVSEEDTRQRVGRDGDQPPEKLSAAARPGGTGVVGAAAAVVELRCPMRFFKNAETAQQSILGSKKTNRLLADGHVTPLSAFLTPYVCPPPPATPHPIRLALGSVFPFLRLFFLFWEFRHLEQLTLTQLELPQAKLNTHMKTHTHILPYVCTHKHTVGRTCIYSIQYTCGVWCKQPGTANCGEKYTLSQTDTRPLFI